MRYYARAALLPDGWAPDVAIDVAPDGIIARVTPASRADAADDVLDGAVVPGMPNAHSHAFQRMMAGSAERRTGGDDFWSWREAMYDAAASIAPGDLHGIATGVYDAMLLAGYTAVAEFHYVHRDPRGAWYADKAAMPRALIDAALDAGIAMCLLPALYAHSDAGGAPLHERQRRFASGVDDVVEIAATLRGAYANESDVVIGTCAHSLRAVTPGELRALLDATPDDAPIHLHVAEQQREVDAVRASLGARPVEWLLANHDVDARWSFVHATHMTAGERDALARSGAVAVLCPTTEANLGDGVFPLRAYLGAHGALAIGSDSNVSISPVEELRWLEYGARLTEQRRLVAASDEQPSCGERLYTAAARGGARACGIAAGAIAPGMRADLVLLDHRAWPVAGAQPEDVLDRYVFATDRAAPRDVIVRGRVRVRDGRLTRAAR